MLSLYYSAREKQSLKNNSWTVKFIIHNFFLTDFIDNGLKSILYGKNVDLRLTGRSVILTVSRAKIDLSKMTIRYSYLCGVVTLVQFSSYMRLIVEVNDNKSQF
jgi:hypothetical protein